MMRKKRGRERIFNREVERNKKGKKKKREGERKRGGKNSGRKGKERRGNVKVFTISVS